MPPNTQETEPSGVLFESDAQTPDGGLTKEFVDDITKYEKLRLVWVNIIWFAYIHSTAVYGIYLGFTSAKWQSSLFGYICYLSSGIGITSGVHRLWTHRTYSAKLPLRIFMMLLFTLAFQGSILDWSRDHRIHHKYSDTDADPHNSKRGLFYSHIGWLCCRKSKETMRRGKQMDLSDLWADPVVAFNKKYFLILMPLMCFVLPTIVPMYFWNESFVNSWSLTLARYVLVLNCTWAINSFAHLYGQKPYDKSLKPGENWSIAMVSFGEGFHNYHHVFPWDYKAAESGFYTFANPCTRFINLMAWMGQATNLKSVSRDMIDKRALRTGDGSDRYYGWSDPDMNNDDRSFAHIAKKDYK